MVSRIHFKYWKNILISRLYEQFSRNDSAMAPEINFQLLIYEHIIYSFEACDLESSNVLHPRALVPWRCSTLLLLSVGTI